MESIKTLREIIAKLTPEEKGATRTYLKVFVLEWKGDTNRGLQLFDYLLSIENRKQTIEEIEMAIYRKPNRPALKRLANRTRIKVLEALIIDINVDREGKYPERIAANIEVRKKLTQAQILHRRGLTKIARGMFENVVTQCRKYELYEEQLIALRLLIRSRTLIEGDAELSKLLKHYDDCHYAMSALMKSELNHTKISAQNDFHSEVNLSRKELRAMLDEMRDDFHKTDSAQIGYYYLHLEAQNYQQNRDFKRARTELLNTYKLLKHSPSINTHDMLIGILLNLADNDLYLGQFERAFEASNEALPLCKKGNPNYEITVELIFYSKFYKGEFDIANQLLLQLIPSEENSINFRTGKRGYLLASTLFMLGDYQAAARHLNVINPIEIDKDGWSLGIKILQIMSAIELTEFDDASGKIEALRKHFSAGYGENNHRAKLIHSILVNLSYRGYNFKNVYLEQKSAFEMLAEKDGALEWRVKSSEMVIFHQWFFAKVSRQPYVQKVGSFQIESKSEKQSANHKSNE